MPSPNPCWLYQRGRSQETRSPPASLVSTPSLYATLGFCCSSKRSSTPAYHWYWHWFCQPQALRARLTPKERQGPPGYYSNFHLKNSFVDKCLEAALHRNVTRNAAKAELVQSMAQHVPPGNRPEAKRKPPRPLPTRRGFPHQRAEPGKGPPSPPAASAAEGAERRSYSMVPEPRRRWPALPDPPESRLHQGSSTQEPVSGGPS